MEKYEFKEIKSICANYCFSNLSIGDIQRTRDAVLVFTKLSNGKAILEDEIANYIKLKEQEIKDAKRDIHTLNKFINESDYADLFKKQDNG